MAGRNSHDEQFDQDLRRRLHAVRTDRGECPSVEALTRYTFDEASWAEKEEVRAHVARCGYCDALLYRMRAFLERGEEAAPPPAAVWAFLRRPLLGYVLALVLAYPAWLGLRPSRPAPPAPPPGAPVEAPPVYNLNQVRGVSGRPSASAAAEHFLVQFTLPVTPGSRYLATVRTAGGRAIVSRQPVESWDDLGNFSLVCRAADFPAGRYSVEVEELPAGSATAAGAKVFTLLRHPGMP